MEKGRETPPPQDLADHYAKTTSKKKKTTVVTGRKEGKRMSFTKGEGEAFVDEKKKQGKKERLMRTKKKKKMPVNDGTGKHKEGKNRKYKQIMGK